MATAIALDIPPASVRATRAVISDILRMLRNGEINNEQAVDAILHWHNSVNTDE